MALRISSKAKGTWRYQFQRDSVVFRGSFEAKNKAEAKEIYQRIKNEAGTAQQLFRSQGLGAVEAVYKKIVEDRANQQAAQIKLEDIFTQANAERLPPSTNKDHRDRCETSLRWWLSFFLDRGITSPPQIRNDDIKDYVILRLQRVAGSTVNRELDVLRSTLNWYQKDVLNAETPQDQPLLSLNVRIKWSIHHQEEPPAPVRVISPDEEEVIFKHLDDRFHPLSYFLLLTGVRSENGRSLTWPQVDLKQSLMRLKIKGGKFLVLPLTPLARSLVERQKGKHPSLVFPYQLNKVRPAVNGVQRANKGDYVYISRQVFGDWWRKAVRAAQKELPMEHCTPHTLRHTFASRASAGGVPMQFIQYTLDHEDITTTERYVHGDNEQILKAMEAAQSARNYAF